MDWRESLHHLIETPQDLARFLGCTLEEAFPGWPFPPSFRMRVTPYYAKLIRPGDPGDPILLQVLPHRAETRSSPDFTEDPLAEDRHTRAPGVIHRYPDRVVCRVTAFCPTFCRFCFRRRHWPEKGEEDERTVPFSMEAALAYVRIRPEVRDVILSGGDPLFLPNARLEPMLRGFRAVPQVRILRVHSRAPVILPARIDAETADLLGRYRPLWFITHFNHPREVTHEARTALLRLLDAGVTVNNQSVLLRGVNDSTEVLEELSLRLLESGVRPYYLHQADRVEGTAHFHVPVEQGRVLVAGLFGRVSGLAVPRYVLDLPGGGGKVPLMPDFMEKGPAGEQVFRAPLGGRVCLSLNPEGGSREPA